MTKGTDKHPHKELQRASSGRVPRVGAYVPLELGCTTLPAYEHLHQPRISLNTIYLGF